MKKVGLLLVSTIVFAIAAELLYRAVGPSRRSGGLPGGSYYADADGERLGADETTAMVRAVELGLLQEVPAEARPRFRIMMAPGAVYRLCYEDWDQPWFDERGCVEMRHNARAIRDREELCEPKPADQRRIVCVGDSFTLGWGVRDVDTWCRLVEDELRRDVDDGVRTVNCGGAGTLFVDEYSHGLRLRFGVFEPDAVVVTLCLNDLLRVNAGLSHNRVEVMVGGGRDPAERPLWRRWSRVLDDLARGREIEDRLALDPAVDWVQTLLDQPEDVYPEGVGRDAFWAGGGPQRALVEMRDWCRERELPFGVVIWPFFQGSDDRERYPFARIHDLVEAFCAESDIPFLDLQPVFEGHAPETLWVTPADMHANPTAHRLAAVPITAFLRRITGW